MSLELIDALERLEQQAAAAERKLATGEAVTGKTALREIRWAAGDAVRHWRTTRGEPSDREGAHA